MVDELECAMRSKICRVDALGYTPCGLNLRGTRTQILISCMPRGGHAGAAGKHQGRSLMNSSSTNLALNMVRTMSAITCAHGDALNARRASLRASCGARALAARA